jgi:hypothetical protein
VTARQQYSSKAKYIGTIPGIDFLFIAYDVSLQALTLCSYTSIIQLYTSKATRAAVARVEMRVTQIFVIFSVFFFARIVI